MRLRNFYAILKAESSPYIEQLARKAVGLDTWL